MAEDVTASAADPSDVEFWAARYRQGEDGWELGEPTPPLKRYFARHSPSGKRALVVGCGRGHEARMLAALGAKVVAVDFVEAAITAAKQLSAETGVAVDYRCRDLFALPSDRETYDLVVEHTCFCAIDPNRRGEYAQVMAQLLSPRGQLVGLFYTHGRPGGPPFATTREEVERLFAEDFVVEHAETPTDSIPRRQGEELLVVLRRR